MNTCNFCGNAPTIENSHVVPNFVGKYIKKNSPFGYLLNSWSSKQAFDIHKGPYLCAACDNILFSTWERNFSSTVWLDPINFRDEWGNKENILFVLSLAYRYALHFIETSPIVSNRPYSEHIRDMTKSALIDPSIVGSSVFIYPYVHRPILEECKLLPGVNHFLTLAIHGQSLPQEGDLPNSFLIVIPKVLFLICDRDLSACNDNEISYPQQINIGCAFDAQAANLDMPVFLSSVLNRCINNSQSHQKDIGKWKRLAFGADKMMNPTKACYIAQNGDRELLRWQRKNCS